MTPHNKAGSKFAYHQEAFSLFIQLNVILVHPTKHRSSNRKAKSHMTPANHFPKAVFLSLVVLCLSFAYSTPAQAVVLWYNGDYEGEPLPDGIINGINIAIPEARVYDDFVVPAGGWTVGSVIGYNLMDVLGVSQAAWEIRSGVSEGNGGTLIAGNTSPATQTFVQGGVGGREEFEIKVSGLNVELNPGTYWLSVAPVGFGPVDFNSVDEFYLGETLGTNFVGFAGNNGNAFVTIPAYGAFFTNSVTTLTTPDFPRPADFRLAIEGTEGVTTTAVPEPATMSLLVMGLLSGAAFRRRSRKSCL